MRAARSIELVLLVSMGAACGTHDGGSGSAPRSQDRGAGEARGAAGERPESYDAQGCVPLPPDPIASAPTSKGGHGHGSGSAPRPRAEAPVCIRKLTARLVGPDGAPVPDVVTTACGNGCVFGKTDAAGVSILEVHRYMRHPTLMVHGAGKHATYYVPVRGAGDVDLGTLPLTPLPASRTPFPTEPRAANGRAPHGVDVTLGDVTLSLPSAAKIEIDALEFPDPSDQRLAVLPVALDKAPPFAEPGTSLAALYAFAPYGTTITPGARLTLLNRARLPKKAAVELFYQGSHVPDRYGETGGFDKLANGHVSADGATITLDDGAVVPELTWLGVGLAPKISDTRPLRVLSDPNPHFSALWIDAARGELFVADDNKHRILVFDRTARGDAKPLRTLGGQHTLIDFPSSIVFDPVNDEVWVSSNDTADRAIAFGRAASGDIPPARVIDFKVVDDTRGYGWAVDPDRNEVFATFEKGSSIRVFDRETGDVVRSVVGPATGLRDPHGMSLDRDNGEIFVVNHGHVPGGLPERASITVYDELDDGDVTPLRKIQGPRTRLSRPLGMFVDAVHDEIAVADDSGAVLVFARNADGDVAPLRVITGDETAIHMPTGVFIDTANDELAVTEWEGHSINVYPRTANGNVAPMRMITSAPGGPVVGTGNPGAMAVDPVHDEMVVTNCVSHPGIAWYPRKADGQVGALRVVEGDKTRISRSIHGLAYDAKYDEVVFGSELEDAVLVFNRLDDGNVPPKRVLQGPKTRITKPNKGIAVDAVNGEIAVVVADPKGVLVFARDADGDVAPRRVLENAELESPFGVWIDAAHDEILLGDARGGIYVFPRTAIGAATPLRTIRGDATMFLDTKQLVVDDTHDEIVVAIQGNRAGDPPIFGGIAVFDRLADGDVSPKRFLRHSSRSFVKHPRSIWVDEVHGEIATGDSKLNEVRVFPREF